MKIESLGLAILLLNLSSTALARENVVNQIESLEKEIRVSLLEASASAEEIGLREFIEREADGVAERVRVASSLADSERLRVLTQLARDAEDLRRTIYVRPVQPNWEPKQATGPPDSMGPGENATSWTPATEDSGAEWLRLTYPQKVDVAQVRVHQNLNPGVVTGVTAATESGELEIWSADPGAAEAPKWLELTPTAAAQTDAITIHLDTKLKKGWNEIDAVELVGTDGSRQWAAKAEASSIYGGGGQGVRVSLSGRRVTNEWLAACASKIADAEQLALYGTSVTDAGLAHLGNLERLISLVLRSPGITGSGLKGLPSTQLKNLDFIDSAANDAGLEAISAIRRLETISLERTRVMGTGLHHLAGMKHLKALSLSQTNVTDEHLSRLPPLPALQNLDLSSTDVTTLAGLRQLKSLRNINLNETQIDDAGLARLGELPQTLESISLVNTKVTGAGLRHLAGMKRLRFLNLNGTAVTDEGLSHLGALPALQHLYLKSTEVTTVAGLLAQKNLKAIDLSETRVDDAGLSKLGAFPLLEMLHLSNTPVWGPGLAGLKDATQLWYVDLNGTRVNDAALAALVELPMLKRFQISGTRITDATLAKLAHAARLEYLDIYGTNVTADGIRHLAAVDGLRELYAGGTAANDVSLAAISRLGQLFHLDLQGTQVTDASLKSIGKFRRLNSLNLSGTAVTGSTIAKLSGIEELRTLNLADTATSDRALEKITDLPVREMNAEDRSGGGFARLNNLILTNTEVTDAGLEHISRLKHLNQLHLDGTNVSDRGLEQISRLSELHALWLDRSAVTDDGIAVLANLHGLRTLSLNRTEITDEALSQIGDAIERLALSHTRVSDAGVGTLANKEGLEVLELAGTAVTDRALETIAELPNLRVVNLQATPISDRGVAALRTLPALTELSLDRTTITDQAAELLAQFESLSRVSLEGTRVTAHGKALLGRRRPGLAVELDLAWVDGALTEGGSVESPWSSARLPEDATVAGLKPLSAIRSLSLRHRIVDAETLIALQDLPHLESLDLTDSSVDDGLLANLIGLSQLRVLRLSGTAISDEGLRHLAGLYALEHLELDSTRITGTGLAHLRGLTRLRSIRLRETLLRDEHAAQLAALKSLREIAATNTRLGDNGLRELERLPFLRYLDLFGTEVSDAGLASIGRMSSLSHLYLSATDVTDAGLPALVGLEQLVELGLDHSRITDHGLRHITGFRHLERLRLDGTRVSEVGVKTISQIESLRMLQLNDTLVSDGAVEDLRRLVALEALEVDGTGLSDHGLGELGSLTSLQRLSVRDTHVSRSGIKAFKVRRPEVALAYGSQPAVFSWIGIALSVLYGLIALAICTYGAHRYVLVWLFLRHRGVRNAPAPVSKFAELPCVTVQIPLFNERNVAQRIIEAVCAMDYPRDRLQIQVLDDSTDDCTAIVRRCCERFRSKGIDIVCHHRDARDGFKSGALAAGLQTASGELVAIFDADFVPAPDFLQRTVHHFTDEEVGVVQTEWRHLNRNESTLTQCQAIFLDGHFVMEQAIRAGTGRWFNFNGTAGLWRRSCIDQSGGWRADTLTEDTDLSYRAQLDGWRFVYLPDVRVDAELPSTMSAFLSQQHRWTRGLLQCAVKLMPRILLSHAPLRVKAEAWFHLTAPILYAVMFLLTALAVPATFIALPLSQLRGPAAWTLGSAVLLGGTIAAAAFYLVAQRAAGQSLWRTLGRLPALMALGVGMSAVNTRAAVGALLGIRSPFVRTPKFGERNDSESDPDAQTRWLECGPPHGTVELLISGLLAACFISSLNNYFALIGAPFILLFAAGFLWVGGARFVESGRRVTATTAARFPALRLSAAAATVVATTAVIVLATDSSERSPLGDIVESRVAGVDLTRAEWKVRGSSVVSAEARRGGLALDVTLDPESGLREEGEIFIDLSEQLASLGKSLFDTRALVFDIAYPDNFSGELQAFVADAEGNNQYGTIAFVERHDTRQRVTVGIAPGSLTPPMGYTDPAFDARRSIRHVGLKVSAQSDRVRGRGYRPFRGELTIASVRVVPRAQTDAPEIRAVPADRIQRPQPASPQDFLASSGADRPWPLGYAFSGPLSAEQRKTLEQTYTALQDRGLGFTRVYIGDYRTGLVFDATGSVAGVEPQFLDYLDELTEIANRHGVTVMLSLMDNTMLDGKGVEFPQFVVDRQESDQFIASVLAPVVEKLEERQVILDLFNEPENVTGADLLVVQDFVDRALAVLRKSNATAKFTVVSRSAHELVYWRGRGLDVLSHNVFDQRSLDSALNLQATTELDAPVWIAEMDPALATVETLAALRQAGYRGVGLWGWGTGDKYDWSADELEKVACPLLPAQRGCGGLASMSGGNTNAGTVSANGDAP